MFARSSATNRTKQIGLKLEQRTTWLFASKSLENSQWKDNGEEQEEEERPFLHPTATLSKETRFTAEGQGNEEKSWKQQFRDRKDEGWKERKGGGKGREKKT